MATATMQRIQEQLKRGEYSSKASNESDELVPILFDMFPEELVDAAAKDLGMEDYIKNIYLFGVKAQSTNASVKKTQLGGMVLTHRKLEHWLDKKGAKSIVDIGNKTVLRAYLQFHNDRIAESTEAIRIVTNELTKE